MGTNSPEEPEKRRSIKSKITNATSRLELEFSGSSYTVIRLKRARTPR